MAPASPKLSPEVLDAIQAERPPDAPRRCFICLTDEDPSDPPGSWVDPCPCTLEAHQDCMMSWVTDCERRNKPLKCPVCKSTIEMEGPWDLVVALNDIVYNRFTKSSPLVLFTGISMGVQFSLQMYGAMALYTFAGKETLMRFMLGRDMVFDANNATNLHFFRERIWSALVMMNVAPALLFSQLLPNLSNKIFLPTASLYGMYQMMHDDKFLSWPPSPRMAIALFPYVRSVYYNLWREFVLPHEIKLNRQILGLPPIDAAANGAANGEQQGPNNARNRRGENEPGIVGLLQNILDALDPDDDDDGGADNGQNLGHLELVRGEVEVEEGGEEGELLIEVQIEEVQEDDEDDEAAGRGAGDAGMDQGEPGAAEIVQDAPGPAEAGNVDAVPLDAPAEQAAGQNDGDGQAQHEAPQAPPRRMGLGGLMSSISNAVVGALILPGVSFVMGEALRLLLPKTWTGRMARNPWELYAGFERRPGLLQQQWGRSLMGGCLYVVLKDAIRVYTKTRKVAALEHRRVKNVDRRRKNK